jgi:hypothetical protein
MTVFKLSIFIFSLRWRRQNRLGYFINHAPKRTKQIFEFTESVIFEDYEQSEFDTRRRGYEKRARGKSPFEREIE